MSSSWKSEGMEAQVALAAICKQLQQWRAALHNGQHCSTHWEAIMAKEQRSTKEKRKPKKAAGDKKK
jgi:hypothetical protein